MKIGIVVDELFTGGFQKVAIEEAIGLKKQGYNIEFIVLRKTSLLSNQFEDKLSDNLITIRYVSDYIPKILNFSFKVPFFAFFSLFHITYICLMKIYFPIKFEYIIVHGTYTSLVCIPYAKKNNIVIANFVHDPVEYILSSKYNNNRLKLITFRGLAFFGAFLDKYIIKNSNLIITYPEIREYLEKRKYVGKYLSIFNGVDISTNSYSKKEYAIAATKWDQGKNYVLLLHLWSKYKIKLHLKIVGRWANQSEKKEFILKIDRLNLSHCIKVIDEIDATSLSIFYGEALFLIHPCKEAFGMTILEAAANRTVSICTNNSGVASLFTNENCYKVRENIEIDYIEAIKFFMLNRQFVSKMGINAFENAKKYSWKIHSNLIIKNICRK